MMKFFGKNIAHKHYFSEMPLKRYLRLSSEALWIIVDQASTAFAGLVGIKVLTHLLDPGEFGRLALANTIVALISMNIFGPVGQSFMRYWAISEKRGRLDVFYTVSKRYTRYAIYVSIILIIIYAVSFGFLNEINWSALLILSITIGVVTGLLGLRNSVFTAARRRRLVASLNAGNAFLRLAFAALLVLVVTTKAHWALVGYFLASCTVFCVAERLYLHGIFKTSSSGLESSETLIATKRLRNEMFSYSWPFLVWGGVSWIHTSCDRWALQTFYGAEVVGAFAVVSQLSIYPLIFGSAFLHTLFTPIAFERGGDLTNSEHVNSANKLLFRMTGVYLLGTVVLIVLFLKFHYDLVLFISNDQFARFSFLLPWLTMAWGLFYLGQVLSTFGLLAGKPRIYITPKFATAIIAGMSTFYLASKMGPVGVAVGLTASGFVYALWCIIITLRLTEGLLKSDQ